MIIALVIALVVAISAFVYVAWFRDAQPVDIPNPQAGFVDLNERPIERRQTGTRPAARGPSRVEEWMARRLGGSR